MLISVQCNFSRKLGERRAKAETEHDGISDVDPVFTEGC
jgi:hypothetical protein